MTPFSKDVAVEKQPYEPHHSKHKHLNHELQIQGRRLEPPIHL